MRKASSARDGSGNPRHPPRQFSLESFRRQAPSKPSPAPVSSPSARRPPNAPVASKGSAGAYKDSIAKINRDSSHAIRAAHTILDPAAIIKELVENALDARATRIDVRVRGKGALDTITISDNGHGIAAGDYESLCLPSTTSKISSFDDLEQLSTFGFRGEALSAICAIAKATTVTTRTADDTVATVLKYANDGKLSSQNAAARPVGTTVQVESVFHVLPVRRKDAIKNHTREVSRCIAVMQALALISVNTRLELKIGGDIKVGNLPAMKELEVPPASLGKVCLSALRCNAKSVLGARTANALIELDTDRAAVVKLPPSARAAMRADGNAQTDSEAAYGCHGLISKAYLDANGSGGRAKSSHQYIFVNRRPVDFPRLARMIKELYRRATGLNSAAPVAILNLVLPAWSCDVNLAPDKRVICVHEEDTLISGILSLLEGIWIPTEAATIPVQKDSSLTYMIQSDSQIDPKENSHSHPSQDTEMVDVPDEPAIEEDISKASVDQVAEDDAVPIDVSDAGNDGNVDAPQVLPESHREPTQPKEQISHDHEASAVPERTPDASEEEPSATPPDPPRQSVSPVPLEKLPSSPDEPILSFDDPVVSLDNPVIQRRSRQSIILASSKTCTTRNVGSFVARRSKSLLPAKRPRTGTDSWPTENLESVGDEPESFTKEIEESKGEETRTIPIPTPVAAEAVFDTPRNESQGPGVVAVVDVDWDSICHDMGSTVDNCEQQRVAEGSKATGEQAFKDATLGDIDNEIVNEAHHRAAEKEMSRLFHQKWFNDFEILGQFNRGFIIARLRNDLFIIDQHASDEKHNFEDLQRNTVISKQRLVHPLGLEFSAQDEVLVVQHLSAFRAGGFDIEYREKNPPTRRLFLKAQPMSKHTIFVQDDLRDIVDMLKSSVVQCSSMKITCLRPPRIRAMFASRACRKSIMIGTALQKPQMTKIVRKLATLDHPWTCPHGRPTMRHLYSLPVCEDLCDAFH